MLPGILWCYCLFVKDNSTVPSPPPFSFKQRKVPKPHLRHRGSVWQQQMWSKGNWGKRNRPLTALSWSLLLIPPARVPVWGAVPLWKNSSPFWSSSLPMQTSTLQSWLFFKRLHFSLITSILGQSYVAEFWWNTVIMTVSAECGLSVIGISGTHYNYCYLSLREQNKLVCFITVSKLEFTLHPWGVTISFSVSCCKYCSSGVFLTPQVTAPEAPRPPWLHRSDFGWSVVLCLMFFARRACFFGGRILISNPAMLPTLTNSQINHSSAVPDFASTGMLQSSIESFCALVTLFYGAWFPI